MFDDGVGDDGDTAAPSATTSDWCLPGRPTTETGPPEPDPCALALAAAVDALLAQDAGTLAPPVARERCRTVLAQAERLGVVVADALVDVQGRELFADGNAGSVSGWLRQQPCGDGGRASRSRRLAARPRIRAAIVDGDLGTSTADVLAKALEDLPDSAEPGQVEGVLTGAVPELLSRWLARNGAGPVAGRRRRRAGCRCSHRDRRRRGCCCSVTGRPAGSCLCLDRSGRRLGRAGVAAAADRRRARA